MLLYFGIYVAFIFGSVVWEAFTVAYKARMEAFQYCPGNNCVIGIDNSTIASDELSFERLFTKCEFPDNMIEIPEEVEFNLRHQITLHLCPDMNGLLGDENGDSGTIRSNCLDATVATSKPASSTPINFLVPRLTPPIPKPSIVEKNTNSHNVGST